MNELPHTLEPSMVLFYIVATNGPLSTIQGDYIFFHKLIRLDMYHICSSILRSCVGKIHHVGSKKIVTIPANNRLCECALQIKIAKHLGK